MNLDAGAELRAAERLCLHRQQLERQRGTERRLLARVAGRVGVRDVVRGDVERTLYPAVLGFDCAGMLDQCIRHIDAARRGEQGSRITLLPALFEDEMAAARKEMESSSATASAALAYQS